LAAGGLIWYLSRPLTIGEKPVTTLTSTATMTELVTSSSVLSGYARFDPRDASTFSNPLRVPSPSGEVFGIIESPSNASINVKSRSLEILPGKPTELWVYEVGHNGKQVINPVLRLKKDETFKATLANGISQKTIIHWHGMIVDWKNDGHPSYAIGQDQTYDYSFQVYNRGGTYWYHPHPHPAAQQVYKGLASFFIVQDQNDERVTKSLDLQLGTTDIPLMIQDKRFNDAGPLEYSPTPDENFMGFLGDMILVNLTPNPYLEVTTRVYRFRILNASSARAYRLALVRGSERHPFYIIGVDAGLLEKPYKVDEVFVGPAERVEILLDLRTLSPGDVIFLKSLQFDPMHAEELLMGEMAGGMAGGSRLEDGEDFHILKLAVKDKVTYDAQIPEKLSVIEPIDISAAEERPISLSASMAMKEGRHLMRWLINGESFDMNTYPIQTTRDKVEIWKVTNSVQSMPHPMHIHGYLFQVLERTDSPPQIRRLAVDSQGRIPTDLGWKDTVLIWPQETVTIAIDFKTRFAGEQNYLFHCHNLEHQDGGMMINYKVT